MMIRRSLIALSAVLLPVVRAYAAPYPVNVCVSSKQEEAGKYCAAVLKAWSKWETKQDAAGRDDAIAAATMKLDGKWAQAEAKATKKDSDCADATISATGLIALLDSAVGAIVDDVNGGLALGTKNDAKCGAKLLKAAGKKCAGILVADSKYIKDLSKDSTGSKRDATQAKASTKFLDAFQKVIAKGCPTTATPAGVEAAIDALAADIVVRNTTISPNVDDAQFTTITPAGPVDYLGKTLNPTCIHDTPYSFFVKRGSVNKLLVYYEGGGACWEQLTCSIPVCDASVKTNAGSGSDNPNFATSGFADQSNPANPFRDWNVVFVSYCSCDIHFGDAAQDYDNTDPQNPLHIEHRGFQNARVVEKWAREHFLNPDQIFVTGSSAGAYGAWFHAPLLHETWPASHFQVLADAGNGVITQDFLANYFPNWNFVGNIPKDFPEIKQIIESGGGIPAYTEFVASHFPETRWAHYATSFDGGLGGQTGFYNVMLNNNNPIAATTWWNGSCAFNAKMRQQAIDTAAAVPSNYRYYIGTGSRHTMWGSNKVYTDTTGGVPLLVDWVNAMLDGTPAWTDVECTNCGLLLPGDVRPPSIPTPPFQQVGPDVVVVCSASGAFIDE
jgi:Pectinacetylesterase